MFKRITFILTFLVVVLIFSGCNIPIDEKDTIDDTTKGEDIMQESTALVENSVALYTIIRAEKASEFIISNTQKLKLQLDKKTGASFSLGGDWRRVDDTTVSDKLEILVGETDRPEYKQALEKLKYEDYSITKIGNKIIIAAHTDANIVKAVNYFIKNIDECIVTNTASKKDVVIESNWFYTFSSTYVIKDVLIDEVSISNYKIIVPEKAKASELNVAELVQKAIAKKCGYVISIISDKDVESENEIIIGSTDRNPSLTYYNSQPNVLNYIIKTDGEKIVLGFGGYTASLTLVSDFESILNKGISDDLITVNNDFKVNTTLNPDYLPQTQIADGADMRIMSTNVLFDKVTIALRAEIFWDYYRIFKPDTIGLQEMTKEWHDSLFPLVSELYGICNPMPTDGVINYTPILYLKDKYTLVESGVTRFVKGRNPWLVTWAVLENKQTGERFIHANTHYTVVTDSDKAANPGYTNLDPGIQWRLENCAIVKAKVLELQAKYNGIPAVITGDFNSNQFSQEYASLRTNTDIRTSMLVATVSDMRDYQSFHTLGLANRGSNNGGAIDHVMVTSNTIDVFVHKILYDDVIIHASDHCPVYADIRLK